MNFNSLFVKFSNAIFIISIISFQVKGSMSGITKKGIAKMNQIKENSKSKFKAKQQEWMGSKSNKLKKNKSEHAKSDKLNKKNMNKKKRSFDDDSGDNTINKLQFVDFIKKKYLNFQ